MTDNTPIHDRTHPVPGLLTAAEAADTMGVSASYLNKLRWAGGGPRFVRIGSAVRYDPRDLRDWIETRKFTSTTEATVAA